MERPDAEPQDMGWTLLFHLFPLAVFCAGVALICFMGPRLANGDGVTASLFAVGTWLLSLSLLVPIIWGARQLARRVERLERAASAKSKES